MLENQTFTPARSTRRRRITTVSLAAGLALGIFATVGVAAATPTSGAQASAADYAAVGSAAPAAVAASPGADTLRSMTTDARLTLSGAENALRDAAAMTADISVTKLDLGSASTAIDTSDLRAAITRLDNLELIPVILLPGLADDAATQTGAVADRVAELQERLDAAQKKADEAKAKAERIAKAKAKAKAEAAAKAKAAAEAEAAAAAAAQAPAQPAAPSVPSQANSNAPGNSVAGAQATAQRLSAGYGWGGDQFSCLVSLWNKESGWNYQAYNASSGATGIPQALPGSKMASAGADWQTNAGTQVKWGLGYIAAAYGSPCSAWSHSQSTGWY